MQSPSWRAPAVWRGLLALSRLVVAPACRLRVSGDIAPELRAGPVILAANHVSPVDPAIMTAACHKAGLAPLFMAHGGVFDVPVFGAAMRASGHIRVDRNSEHATDSLAIAVRALHDGAMVMVYPEGRIGLDPWMWPERGKTGVGRMALASGAPVVPVAQWGAHAVMPYKTPRGWPGSLARALRHRPVVQVRFGKPVDLSGLTGRPGAQAMQATRLIMAGIDATLAELRPGEMRTPHFIDTSRPPDRSRTRPRP